MSFKGVRLASFERPPVASRSNNGVSEQPTPVPIKSPQVQGLIDLVDNPEFKVQLLPSKPAILDTDEAHAHGTIDALRRFASLSTTGGCYVWEYESGTTAPNALYFPFEDNTGAKATLVPPVVGQKEPGLVSVTHEGLVTYWEAVSGALADGLFEKGQSLTVNLGLSAGEQVDIVTSIDPIGVAVSTTNGRLFSIRLRDAFGKQTLEALAMKGTNQGFFRSVVDGIFSSSWRRNIVSINPGEYLNGQSDRLVYTVNASGALSIWRCGINGTAALLCATELERSIKETVNQVYPQVYDSFRVHDIASLRADSLFVLASFKHSQDETYYLLTSLDVDIPTNSFKIISTYRLQTFTSNSVSRPQLLLPEPGRVLYVVYDQAVVLLDTTTRSLDQESPRWEDVVSLKSDVRLFGASASHNSIVLESNNGMISLEMKYEHQQAKPVGIPGENDSIRLKLEQAVFFSRKSNPVSFDPRDARQFPVDKLALAIESLAYDIAQGTASGIPAILPSLSEHLELRRAYLATLATYAVENFTLQPNTCLVLHNTLQKLSAAASLWKSIDGNSELSKRVRNIVSVDVREWFATNTLEIEKVVVSLGNDPRNLTVVTNSLIAADMSTRDIHLLRDVEKIDDSPWLASDEMFNVLENFAGLAESITDKNLLVGLVEVLCGTSILRLVWLRDQDPKQTSALEARATELQLSMLGLLTVRDYRDDAVRIAERFSILGPLARLLADEWLVEIRGSLDEAQAPQTKKIYFFMDRFGYDFAEELFQRLVDLNQIKLLVNVFATDYKHHVQTFLLSDDVKLARISWVLQTFDGRLDTAAETLALATDQEPRSVFNKRILASMQKLAAIATVQPGLVVSADRELVVLEAQQAVYEQFTVGGRSLIVDVTDRRGIAQLLLHVGTVALTREKLLTATELVDLLTYLPMKTTPARLNYALALNIIATFPHDAIRQARLAALAQQIILNMSWASVSYSSTDEQLHQWAIDSILYQTLRAGSPESQELLIAQVLNTNNWPAPTEKEILGQVYPWATPSTATQISNDLAHFNQSVDKLLKKSSEVPNWIRAVASKFNQDLEVMELD